MAARGRRDLKTITTGAQVSSSFAGIASFRLGLFLSCFECLFFPQSIRFSDHDCAVISGTWHGSAFITVIDFVYVCIFRYIQ